MTSELKPYQFCNAKEAKPDKKWNSRVIYHEVGCFLHLTEGSTRIMMGERYKEAQYVGAWNTRSPDTSAVELVRELLGLVTRLVRGAPARDADEITVRAEKWLEGK